MKDLAEYNQEGKKDPSSVNEALLKSQRLKVER
jgi:hypothetical protein